MAVKTSKRPARRSKKKVSARRTRATKRASTKCPRETTSQAVPDLPDLADLPVPTSSEEFAFQVKERNLAICEEHRTLAKVFYVWCIWFTGANQATDAWIEEVWKYLPEAHWTRVRIEGYLFRHRDDRIRKLTAQQLLLTDPEAFLWLGNTNCVRSSAVLDAAIRWMRRRWGEGVFVSAEALTREFRRKKRMRPKLYFTNESTKVRVTVQILDESCTDAELKRAAQYVLRNGCKRSTIQRTESGNYTESRPR